MRILWLTLADPDPADNGQFLYSGGLIAAAAAADAELEVIGFSRPGNAGGNRVSSGGIFWRLTDHLPRSRLSKMASILPPIVSRCDTWALGALVRKALTEGGWDSIVFDGISLGWALSPILRHYRLDKARPQLVYIAHNDETTVARRIAKAESHPIKRHIRRLDALKMDWLESRLVTHADLVTSNTPEDCTAFRARRPQRPVEFIPPGYGGAIVREREITRATPRRAVILGTFDWAPKRTSLESFLGEAEHQLAAEGIDLQVVGGADASYLKRMRGLFPSTTFTGPVPDITAYAATARLGLVPDLLGGFKLKSLDYVFNRLPIFGIDGSVPGLSLQPREGILLYDDHKAMTKGIIDMIDDIDGLNSLQQRAYATCSGQFEWSAIGRRLLTAMQRSAPANNLDTHQKLRPQPL